MTAVLFFSAKVGEKYIYEYLYLSVSPSDAVFILSTKCPDVSLFYSARDGAFLLCIYACFKMLKFELQHCFSLAEMQMKK